MSEAEDREAAIKAKAEERIERMKTALSNAMQGLGNIEAIMIQKFRWAERKQREECLSIALKARVAIDKVIETLDHDKKEEDKEDKEK